MLNMRQMLKMYDIVWTWCTYRKCYKCWNVEPQLEWGVLVLFLVSVFPWKPSNIWPAFVEGLRRDWASRKIAWPECLELEMPQVKPQKQRRKLNGELIMMLPMLILLIERTATIQIGVRRLNNSKLTLPFEVVWNSNVMLQHVFPSCHFETEG